MKTVVSRILPAIAFAFAISSPAMAAPINTLTITDLFNTGVNGSGNALNDGEGDSHYFIGQGDPSTVITEDGHPIPTPWVPNNTGSRWIGNNADDGITSSGSYTFQTSFTIFSGADLSTAEINGLFGADNSLTDILLNGVSQGGITGAFGSLTAFSVSSDFVIGENILEFVINNAGAANDNPMGLRIDNASGSYQLATAVPEPGSLALLGLGLAGLGFSRRKNNA